MTHDEMIEVIKAHKEGKSLQIRTRTFSKLNTQWSDLPKGEDPQWNFYSIEYRVKPEPMVCYARVIEAGCIAGIDTCRARVEERQRRWGGRIVKLVEVEE